MKRLIRAVTVRLQPGEYVEMYSKLANDTKGGGPWPGCNGYAEDHSDRSISRVEGIPSDLRPVFTPRLRDFKNLFEIEIVPHPSRQADPRDYFVRVIKSWVPRNKAWTPQQAVELFRLMGLAQFGAIPYSPKLGDLSEEAGWR